MGQHAFVNEIAGQPRSSPRWPGARRIRLRWILTGVAVAIVVLLLLAYVPTGENLSFRVSACSAEVGSLDVPRGTALSVSWTLVSGASSGIAVTQGSFELFQSPQAAGSAVVSVVGLGGVSIFAQGSTPCQAGTTQVQVSWHAALLWWLVGPD